MKTGTMLRRVPDGKCFFVVDLAHWSWIRADDGERACVKWAFDDRFVGQDGQLFEVVR